VREGLLAHGEGPVGGGQKGEGDGVGEEEDDQAQVGAQRADEEDEGQQADEQVEEGKAVEELRVERVRGGVDVGLRGAEAGGQGCAEGEEEAACEGVSGLGWGWKKG